MARPRKGLELGVATVTPKPKKTCLAVQNVGRVGPKTRRDHARVARHRGRQSKIEAVQQLAVERCQRAWQQSYEALPLTPGLQLKIGERFRFHRTLNGAFSRGKLVKLICDRKARNMALFAVLYDKTSAPFVCVPTSFIL